MSDAAEGALVALAEAAGIAPRWRDVHGEWRDIAPDVLRAVLKALGVPAGSPDEVAASRALLQRAGDQAPALRVLRSGQRIDMPGPFEVELESGHRFSGADSLSIDEVGYHFVRSGEQRAALAVAPARGPDLPAGRPWGLAVQLYGLRRDGDGGIGDYRALARLAATAAKTGADALAISPVHAQFSADVNRFSPYAPSSRIMLNALHVDAGPDAELEQLDLIDWPRAATAKLARLRARFDALPDRAALDAFRATHGQTLERHARFEALHAHFYGSDPSLWHWASWPPAFRNPADLAVDTFAREHADDVAFHAWLQMCASDELTAANDASRAAGMRIGLIADLAVGTDGGGSHAWSRQDEMMIGLSVGAPPDLWNKEGQNWGIAAFSPLGLRRHGYAAFIEMLRAALRHAGGVRIDHVMGLQRLWVVPDGARAADGAYLTFPIDDMLALVALEAHRHGAIVLGEDLGTVPEGFQPKLVDNGVLGMRVLWFERDGDALRPPGHWSRQAVSMTTTHDLPTVAGWWHARDLDWRERLGWDADPARYRAERAHDRGLMWQAFRDSGSASGDQPAVDDTWPVVQAALCHVGRAACDLTLIPLEDVLAQVEQPNLPATTDQHPNWRRRTPALVDALLDPPEVQARLDAFRAARGGTRPG